MFIARLSIASAQNGKAVSFVSCWLRGSAELAETMLQKPIQPIADAPICRVSRLSATGSMHRCRTAFP
jgi:hypothetical protein